MNRILRHFVSAAVAVLAIAGCAGASRTAPRPAPQPTITQQRSAELLMRAREARGKGEIKSCLEFYQRAIQLGGPSASFALQEALQIMDGLRLEVASGNRQGAGPGSPPRLPLMASAHLELVGSSDASLIPAVGVPILWRWSTSGKDELVGDRTTDEHGMVTLRVQQMPAEPTAWLELFVDADQLPLPQTSVDPDVAAALQDAKTALRSRAARFEFLPITVATKSRVIVLIDEKVFDRPVAQSLVSDRLTTTLVDRGVKVVGSTEMGKSDYEKLWQSFDPEKWVALAPTLAKLCDYVVYGHVDVRRDYQNEGGGKLALGRGRVSLYSTSSPEIMASVDFSEEVGFASDLGAWMDAAEECLRKCAEKTTTKLVPLVVQTSGQ